MNVGPIAVCMILLGVAAWMWWRRKAQKTTTLLALLAGLGLGLPLGLWLGSTFNRLIGSSESQIGVVVSAVLTAGAIVVILEILIRGIFPRSAQPRRWHPWVALLMPMVIIAAGVPVVAWAVGGLSTSIGDVSTWVANGSGVRAAGAAGDVVNDVAARAAGAVKSG